MREKIKFSYYQIIPGSMTSYLKTFNHTVKLNSVSINISIYTIYQILKTIKKFPTAVKWGGRSHPAPPVNPPLIVIFILI